MASALPRSSDRLPSLLPRRVSTSRAAGRPAPARQRSRSLVGGSPGHGNLREVSVGVAWSRSELTASLAPTLGDKKSSGRCGLEQPGVDGRSSSTQPQLQAVTHAFRPAAFGFLQCSLRLCVERTGSHRGVEQPPPIPRNLTTPPRRRVATRWPRYSPSAPCSLRPASPVPCEDGTTSRCCHFAADGCKIRRLFHAVTAVPSADSVAPLATERKMVSISF